MMSSMFKEPDKWAGGAITPDTRRHIAEVEMQRDEWRKRAEEAEKELARRDKPPWEQPIIARNTFTGEALMTIHKDGTVEIGPTIDAALRKLIREEIERET
jgi:hypothetical protein